MKNPTSVQYIVRARAENLGIWVFLAKDAYGRKTNGSVYYWSTNMAISTCLFDTPDAALKKLDRLKIKHNFADLNIVPFEKGVQMVELD